MISEIPQQADGQNEKYWYLLRATFERICGDYDVTATARHLRDLGYLRCGHHSLTSRAPRRLFHKRLPVFTVSKKLTEDKAVGGYHG